MENKKEPFNGLGGKFNKAFLEREERGIWQLLGPSSLKKLLKGVLPDYDVLNVSPRSSSYEEEELEYILSRCPALREYMKMKKLLD